jgi:hypothetical protein
MVISLLGHALDLEGRAFVLAKKGGNSSGPSRVSLSYKDITMLSGRTKTSPYTFCASAPNAASGLLATS